MLKLNNKRTKLNRSAMAAITLAGLLACANTLLLRASAQEAANQSSAELKVTASFADKQVAPDTPIELSASRATQSDEGRLAVVIGRTDLTSLFTAIENTLRYNHQLLPLPLGESEMIVYLVTPAGEWKEIARFALRVSNDKPAAQEQADKPKEANANQQPDAAQQEKAAQQSDGEKQADAAQEKNAAQDKPAQKRLGFEKLDFLPSVTLGFKSQPAQSTFPVENRPERATFNDLNLQMSLKSEMARGPFSSQTQFDLAGSSFQKEALRFGELGERAPQVDLASYLMQLQAGKLKFQTGHFSFGTNRHLINSFSSRGVMLSFPISSRADFAATIMNGTSIVGFGNFFGLANRKHQLVSGSLGFEFLPKRPGGLRLEAGMLEGWLLPVNGFSQSSVNDAERSRGLSLRLIASDPSQRVKLDAGFTRCQFTNPADPLLNQNASVREVPSITRNARYLDAAVEVLKDVALTKEKKINLTFSFKHETVDPLFRSLGASTQADKTQNEFSLVGSVGEINAQFTHGRSNDNLAAIATIPETLNRANTLQIGVPLASLFGNPAKPSLLLPRLSYNLTRTHNFGQAIPVNGKLEIDPASLADQLSAAHAVTADWQIKKLRIGYRFNYSFQNNQQPGSELADFANTVNGFGIGIAASNSLDLNLDINAESASNKASATIDSTLRLAPAINWRMSKRATFATNFSTTVKGDRARTSRNRDIEFDAQWTYQFAVERDRFRKVQGQFFIRYANQYGRARNFLIPLNELRKNQVVNLGLSFNFF